jgi:hypothetical protein
MVTAKSGTVILVESAVVARMARFTSVAQTSAWRRGQRQPASTIARNRQSRARGIAGIQLRPFARPMTNLARIPRAPAVPAPDCDAPNRAQK